MAEESKAAREQLEALRSLPLDDSSEEKVDALWRQLLVYKSFADTDLSEAKARRAQAEAAREQAQMEAIRATQLQCARMRTEAEAALRDANSIRAEAAKLRSQMEAELEKARQKKSQADEEYAQMMSDAEKKAQEVVDGALEKARQETTDLRRHALQEIKTVLNRVEGMRSAVTEELETQRILTNISKIKANARWLMNEGAEGNSYAELEGNGDGAWVAANADWQAAYAAEDGASQPHEAEPFQEEESYSEPAPRRASASSRKRASSRKS
ncbi:MAG: hypothetical protein L0177_04115 [Chloroflexi bacterium]|nr:hypothetical protein [Chloroflexota bacterium]